MTEKYQPYPEYRDSNVDWIAQLPTSWELVRVKSLFSIKKRIAGELGHHILSITQKGIRIKDVETGEGQLSMDYSKYQRVLPGDFAMNHMDLLTGYVDISKYDGVTSPDYRVFSIDSKQNYPRFFLYLFQMGYQQKIFYHMGQGASHLGRWRLATEEFNDLVFPVPTPDEQHKIATFLDYETGRIDKLIEKQQKLIELLKEKSQAVISHAVTKGLTPDVPMKDSGVEWLGKVPKHWVISRLKYEAKIVDCKNRTPEYFDDGSYLVVRTTNVKNQNLLLDGALYTNDENFKIWTQRGIPPVGSILFTREAPTGEVCLVPEYPALCMGQRMMNFIPHDSKYTVFLFDYLTSDCLNRYIESEASGSTVTHLRVEQVYNIPVVIPPYDEQVKIDQLVGNLKNNFNLLIEQSNDAIELMKERRTALISAAVTGKIDLRGWQPPAQESA